MKKINFTKYFLFIASVLIHACNTKSDNPSVKLIDSLSIVFSDSTKITEIVKEIYYMYPKFVAFKQIDTKPVIISAIPDENLISGDANIYVIENFANNWQEKFKITIEYGNRIENFDWITIKGVEYLYFDFIIPGGSAGNAYIRFCLYDFNSNRYFYLEFSGLFRSEQIDGKFQDLDRLKGQPEILAALEQKASKSEKIFRPSEEDLDDSHPKNASRKFLLDNPSLYTSLKRYKYRYNYINITKYSGKYSYYFREMFGDVNDETLDNSFKKISNNSFAVYSLFKGCVLCFDKSKNYYFVAWRPFYTNQEWVDKMNLTNENILTLFNRFDDKPEFVIDLNDLKIKCVSSINYD